MNETLAPSDLAARFERERGRLARAARDAGRAPNDVRLLAVTKTHPAEIVRAAYALGQRDFGENYVQELVDKAAQLADLPELRFRLIGRLQTNKAKYVAPFVSAIDALDSEKLARELGRRADERRPPELGPIEVLVAVNVSGEASKGGVPPEAARDVAFAVDAEPRLVLRGLMTIPPASDDPDRARPHFEALARLRDELGGRTRLPELSMGMSHDAEVAVAAGATWVRIGTALFGARTRSEP